jgi:voltage-gated potassium channel
VRFIESYAADDEVLLGAGIERARAVIACVDSDADNIFIALTARGLRPDILIIARASAEDAEKKLLRAGADRVISPYKTSGSEMARVAVHPQVGGALQVADYRMEEIEVSPSCEGVGKTVEQVRGASVIVALRRADGRLEPQPAPDSVIETGDMLVAIGTPEALERLETVFQPVKVASA